MMVSVVIPVYNSEDFLEKMLNSVLNQTLKDIQVICVDDGSTDSSLDILRGYEKKDARVRVISIAHSGKGAAHARNIGMQYATGQYLSFLDSDDFFEPDMLQKMVNTAQAYGSDVVITNAYEYDSQTGQINAPNYFVNTDLVKKDIFTYKDLGANIFDLTLGAAWNLLLRKEFVQNNKIKFYPVKHADDLFFVYYSFLKAEKISLVNERLLYYRINNAKSQSGNIDSCTDSAYEAWNFLKETLISENLYSGNVKKSLINRFCLYALFYLESITRYENFFLYYNNLKNEYLPNFDFDKTNKDYFANARIYNQMKLIISSSCQEYIFQQYRVFRNLSIKKSVLNFEVLGQDSKIVLYGAGDAGKALFSQIMNLNRIKLVSWVDKNAKQIGFPVQEISIIADVAFDYVIIAIYDATVVEAVKNTLVCIGVDRVKILSIQNLIEVRK